MIIIVSKTKAILYRCKVLGSKIELKCPYITVLLSAANLSESVFRNQVIKFVIYYAPEGMPTLIYAALIPFVIKNFGNVTNFIAHFWLAKAKV